MANTSQSEVPASRVWKRLFIVSAGLGAGAAAFVLAASVATFWYTTRPARARPWDTRAVDARFSGMSLTTSQPLVMTFSYTVENHTGRDYELPPSSSIYKALSDGKGLRQDSTLKWDGGTLVPAGQKVDISIQVAYEYPNGPPQLNDELNAWTNRRLAEIDGFVALDQTSRFEIRFPKPPPVNTDKK